MSPLPKRKDSQECQGLPPRRKRHPELFMQRMRQAIQRTNRNTNVKAENTNKYSFLCTEDKNRGDGNQGQWESSEQIPHKHHEMGAKIGTQNSAMESSSPRRGRCNLLLPPSLKHFLCNGFRDRLVCNKFHLMTDVTWKEQSVFEEERN